MWFMDEIRCGICTSGVVFDVVQTGREEWLQYGRWGVMVDYCMCRVGASRRLTDSRVVSSL